MVLLQPNCSSVELRIPTKHRCSPAPELAVEMACFLTKLGRLSLNGQFTFLGSSTEYFEAEGKLAISPAR